MILKYGTFFLDDQKVNSPDEISLDSSANCCRIEMPCSIENEIKMQENRYILADRTLKVSVNLSKLDNFLLKQVRLPVVKSSDFNKDIEEIAFDSFKSDRRFHFLPRCNQDIANLVIKDWVDSLDSSFVCSFKDQIVGFLNLKNISEKEAEIYLAAVKEKYRLAGSALALYTTALFYAKNNGMNIVTGRISTANLPVLNLYSSFGAKFSEAHDIFLKELS